VEKEKEQYVMGHLRADGQVWWWSLWVWVPKRKYVYMGDRFRLQAIWQRVVIWFCACL